MWMRGQRDSRLCAEDVQTPLTIMMGMVLLVIAMAVVNVASLLLVRAAGRSQEFAVRYALGATSGQVLRQLLAEGLLLGGCGAAIGLLLAPQALRRADSLVVGRVAGRGPAVYADAGLACAAVYAGGDGGGEPAVQSGTDGAVPESEAGGGNERAGRNRRRAVAEVPAQLRGAADRVQPATDGGGGIVCADDRESAERGCGIRDGSSAGVRSGSDAGGVSCAGGCAGGTAGDRRDSLRCRACGAWVRRTTRDLAGDDVQGDVLASGYTPKPDEDFDVELPWVSNDYLQTLGIPLVAGRYFNEGDTATSEKVAVVNESFAKHFYGECAGGAGTRGEPADAGRGRRRRLWGWCGT